jgi:hypothetical protein
LKYVHPPPGVDPVEFNADNWKKFMLREVSVSEISASSTDAQNNTTAPKSKSKKKRKAQQKKRMEVSEQFIDGNLIEISAYGERTELHESL